MEDFWNYKEAEEYVDYLLKKYPMDEDEFESFEDIREYRDLKEPE